jgi:hypothetical protein
MSWSWIEIRLNEADNSVSLYSKTALSINLSFSSKVSLIHCLLQLFRRTIRRRDSFQLSLPPKDVQVKSPQPSPKFLECGIGHTCLDWKLGQQTRHNPQANQKLTMNKSAYNYPVQIQIMCGEHVPHWTQNSQPLSLNFWIHSPSRGLHDETPTCIAKHATIIARASTSWVLASASSNINSLPPLPHEHKTVSQKAKSWTEMSTL